MVKKLGLEDEGRLGDGEEIEGTRVKKKKKKSELEGEANNGARPGLPQGGGGTGR